jgi:hypothetical protein
MKMPLTIVFLILFSFGKPAELLDSNGVWNKLAEFVDDGKMDFNKNYFIFDLKDYANIYSDNTKRYTFTQKQKYLYDTYGIKNYLFIVNDIDSKETIITLAKNLQTLISKNYGSITNSIIICMAIDIRKTRIEIGSTLNYYIYDEDGSAIIDSMGDYMRSANYYSAFCKALEKVEYYYNLGKSGNRGNSSSSSGDPLPVWAIILIIVVILIVCAKLVHGFYYGNVECETTGYSSSYHSHGGFHHSGGGYHKSGGGSGGRSGGRTGGATGGW